MKRLKCKKEFGVWFYEKIPANDLNGLDAPIYSLYDTGGNFENNFGSYGDMKLFVETGVIYG